MKDTDAALKPGCRAGWGRRGGLKRIPRRHTLQEWKTTTTIATGQATVKPDTPSCFPDCALGLGCTSAGACPASRTSLDTSDALSNATNDTNAVLRPGCRAGWGRRGGLKRIPRRHTLQEWETTTTIATGQATATVTQPLQGPLGSALRGGGGGGQQARSRQRQEQQLLEGLKLLFQQLSSRQDRALPSAARRPAQVKRKKAQRRTRPAAAKKTGPRPLTRST